MDNIFKAIHLLARNIAYQFRFEGIINIFDSEMEKLISTRNLVLDEVEATNNKKEKINDTVLEWLSDAEKLMEEITKMEIEIETNSNGYFLWIFSAEKNYQLYDQMQKKIKLLYTKCEFEQFYNPIPGIEYFSSGYFVCFKSTKEASDQLLEALQDDSSYIIGLHGMQGSGKTKLVKAVGEKAKFLKLFDAVVFDTVSQYPHFVWFIQNRIAECFDLNLDRDDEEVRASSVSSKLQQSEERILVILDDVQARFELEDIGIPYNSNRCKVLLTTRHQQICTLMDCEREIPLHPLSEEEAWKLFKKHSGIDKEDNESSSNLLEVARKVAIECEGLPAKIKDVGSSLRRKPIEEWEAALEKLRPPCGINGKQFDTPNPGIEYFSSGYFVCFKSTKEASDQLLEALQDDSSYIIGLHGMQGSGKTKLVKAVGEKAKFLKLFDAVVFLTVSQYPRFVWFIQNRIAKCFDLNLDRDDEEVRASSVSSKLQQSEERILVILDDVQARFELEDIGIPYNSNRCKVLLTTRHQQICTLMDCEREIPLHPLSEEEAWKLFKKHSGIDKENDESSSNLLEVARKVAIECEGLPAKIKDVGSSLRRNPIEEWEATLENLRHPWDCYQVFLSFRGQDTRYSFTGFLYDALCRGGFKTFMDDRGLEGGDQISLSLIAAIEASWLSIIVLSENYAYSSWCLDELVTILECKKTKNQLVLPIFYKVDPTDVRYQRNSYSKAMEAHEKRFGKDSEKVRTWRSTLFEVAGLSGDHYTIGTGYEYQFIQKIVGKVNNNKRLYIQNMDGNHKFPLR